MKSDVQYGRPEDLERTVSWTESGRSVLSLNIRHLWLFGLWSLSESQMFFIYTAYGFSLGVWNVVEGALAAYFTWGDMEQTTLVLMATSTNCNGLVKMAFFLRDRRLYHALVRRVGALLTLQAESCAQDSVLAEVLRGSRRRAFRLTLGMLLFMFSQCFIWFPMPAVAHAEERRLPFAQHPWDNNTGNYALSYFAQCAAGLWMTQISFGMDCLFASVMILLAAQLEIVAGRIVRLGAEASAPLMEKDGGWKKHPTAKSADRMYDDMRLCVESHQKILSFVAHLQDTMSPIAMTQFAFSVLVICFGLFQSTYSEDFSAVLKCASFLPIPCGQVYLYCWAANNVTIQAEAVTMAAYSSSWVEATARFKRALGILISRAQKPLILTAGNLYPIDREAFLSKISTFVYVLVGSGQLLQIVYHCLKDRKHKESCQTLEQKDHLLVNASYSYYALLSQMNNR